LLPSEIEKKLTQQFKNDSYKNQYKEMINKIKDQLRQHKLNEQNIKEVDFFKRQ
jgi:hypothetical protein